jgi:hypothetical protein
VNRLTIFLVLVLPFQLSWGQDLRGYWKGSLNMKSGCFPVNNIELQIQIDNGEVRGDSYHYLDINNYVKKIFSGSYNAESKKIIVQEGLVTTFRIRPECQVCIKRYELYYSRNGEQETLSGGWTGAIMSNGQVCEPGTIVLTRTRQSAFREIPEVLVDTGQLRLDFYDNNEIDGDSISVLVNGKPILTHQKLNSKPLTTYVQVSTTSTFQEVEMIAENLGSIPPNTALLVVTAGRDRYHLYLTSTEEKSAKVRFVFDPLRRGSSAAK